LQKKVTDRQEQTTKCSAMIISASTKVILVN